jgi:RNA polymerase sigma-32 factor
MPVAIAVGNLDSYIQTVNRFPILTEMQEKELATRLREENDLEAARQLVLSHLRLVVAIARNYLGYGLPHADLIQEGNVGLMKAVKRFDPNRGVRLVSFAIHWIKAEIHEYILRNWRLVKIATTKAQRKLFFNLRSMRSGHGSLGREEVESVARQLRVKPEEVTEMEIRLTGQDIALENGAEDDDDRMAPIGYLADPVGEPSQVLAERQHRALQEGELRRAIEDLDSRSRAIIERRWLVEGQAATLHELAAEYNVSAERIRQIEAKAMQKIRGYLTV